MTSRNPVPVLIYLVFMVVYLAGAAPEPIASDGADLATAGFSLAPAHPPGYIATVLLFKTLGLFPLGPIALRFSVAVAALSAAGLGLLHSALTKRVSSPWGAALAAVWLGLSPLVVSQSTRIEVYAVSLFLFAAILYHLLAWRASGNSRSLCSFLFLSALALTHHPGMLCMVAPSIALVLLGNPRPGLRRLSVGALCASAWLGLLVALTVRSGRSWETASLTVGHLRDLWYYASAVGYRSFSPFALDGPYRMLLHAARTVFDQFSILAWPILVVGVISLARRDRSLLAVVACGMAINVTIFLKGGILPDYTIFMADTHVWPTLCLLSLPMGAGAGAIVQWVRTSRPGRPHWAGKWATPMWVMTLGSLPILNLRSEGDPVHGSRSYYPFSQWADALPDRGTILSTSTALHYYAVYRNRVEARLTAAPVYLNRLGFDPQYERLLAEHRGIVLRDAVENLPQPVYATRSLRMKSTRSGQTIPVADGMLLTYPPASRHGPEHRRPHAGAGQDPEWAVFLQWLAMNRSDALLRSGRLEEAEWDARSAVRLLPSNPAALLLLGRTLAARQRFHEARSSFSKAVDLIEKQKSWSGDGPISPILDTVLSAKPNAYSEEPLLVQAYNALGLSLIQENNAAAAVEPLERGAAQAERYALQDELAVIRFNLALAYTGGGETERAIEVYRALLETAPDHIEALNNCAALLLEMDRPAEALPMADRLLTSARDARPLQTAGLVFLRTTRHPQAIAAFERALTLGTRLPPPEIQRLHLHLADAYLNARQLERAEAHRKIAREIVAR